MWHLRSAVLAALVVVALFAAPAAARDQDGHRGHTVVTPANGRLLGESTAQIYSLPASENPFLGNGNHCLRLAPKVVQAVEGGPCTVEEGTADMIGLGAAWSNVEPPFPADEAAQRAVAFAGAQDMFKEIHLIIDNGAPIEIRIPRFELFSEQRTVQLPADNILGVPPQTITVTAYGWDALIRNLRPGPHTIVQEALLGNGDHGTLPYTINVIRHRDSREGHGDSRAR